MNVTYIADVFFCELSQGLQTHLFIEKGEVVSDEFVEIACADVEILVALEDRVAFEDRHDFDTAVTCGDDYTCVATSEVEGSDTAQRELYFIDFEFTEHDFGEDLEYSSIGEYFFENDDCFT